jgi:transcriptional regulator with XRE-family HTH domain
MTKPHSNLGSLIRTKRELAGLTQQELADQAGVSRESINRVENATGTWTPRARKIAQVLLTLEIGVPEITDTVDDPELYVELVSELDKLAQADFRSYVTQQRTGAPVAGPAPIADLIVVSPSGATCIVEVKGNRRVKQQTAGDLAAALGEAGWIVSTTV